MTSPGGAIRAVIRREYLQRVRTRSFFASTVGFPLLLLALVAVPAFLTARSAEAGPDLVLVDRTGVLEEAVGLRLLDLGLQVSHGDPAASVEALMEEVVEAGGGTALVLDAETLARGRAVYLSREPPNALRRFGLRHAVAQAALEVWVAEDDRRDELQALVAGGELEVRSLEADEEGELRRATGLALGAAGAFFLYFILLIYGAIVLRSVMEEKMGRIVEIIVSSMRPSELMLGKILGVGAVGLTQLMIWLVLAGSLLAWGLPFVMAHLPETQLLVDPGAILPGPGVFVYFVVSFVLGYFLYSGLFAAVGAMCTTEEEAQQLQIPVVLLVVVPVLFLMPVIEDPGSGMARTLSLVPFFAPILMFARVVVGGAASWEVALSVALMVGALGAVAWVAGRIYRVGILMQGKRPSLGELWRWIRA